MRIVHFLLIFTLFTSCHSVNKYNAQISKMHTVSELREDVDYAYKKLQRLQPNLYLYIDKKDLNYKFDSLKSSFSKPLSSRQLYLQLAPLVTSIRQGHTAIAPPFKEQTKKDLKQKGKRKNPFRKFRFRKVNDKVYLVKNFGKDSSIYRGSELLKIEDKEVSEILNSIKHLLTGDGFNTTLVPEISSRYIGSFYLRKYGYKDSLQLTLNDRGRIYKKYVYAYPKKKQFTKKEKPLKVKLTKEDKKVAKIKRKARKKWESKHGYNKKTKELTRELRFISNRTIPIVAYLKIRRFMNGNYERFYEDTFKRIDSAKAENLIIDLRYNGGGRLSEIGTLYSYLISNEHQFISNAKMTRNSSWMYPLYHNNSFFKTALHSVLYPVALTIQFLKVKKENGASYFKFKNNKLKKPSEEYNYKGNIYVLINGASFSASSIISNNLQANKRAYFIGDETGGAYNSTVAGRMADVELPNSKVILYIGLMNLETPNKTLPDGFGVKPDKYIPTTTLNTDEQMDWVLSYIKSNKK
ncbi:MAG: S41 family peptidase [Flavobacteriaceae bacterium]